MANELIRAGTEGAGVVPELWSARFYPVLLEALPFKDSVARDYEGEIQALGDTVNINTWAQFGEAQVIQEDEAASADSSTATKSQLVINQRVTKDFIITKRMKQQSIDSMDSLRDLAIHAILKKMESLIRDAIVPSASAPDHQIAFDSGTTLALSDLLEAKELLDNADVEKLGRVLLMGVAQENDLFNITGFTSRDFIPAGSPLADGAISTPVLGFRPESSSEIGNAAYCFHPLFMQMAVQQNPEVVVYDQGGEGKRSERVNMDVLFGLKQMSNLRVVSIS